MTAVAAVAIASGVLLVEVQASPWLLLLLLQQIVVVVVYHTLQAVARMDRERAAMPQLLGLDASVEVAVASIAGC